MREVEVPMREGASSANNFANCLTISNLSGHIQYLKHSFRFYR